MDGIAAKEVHVAKLHPDVDEQLLIASDIVIVTTLIHTDDVTIGDQSVLVVYQTACGVESGVEDKRQGSTLILLHRLVEELTGIQVGHDDREIEIFGEDTTIGITLAVAIAVAVLVIVLYGETL